MLIFYLTMLDDEADRSVFEQIYINHAKDMYRRAYRILRKKLEEALRQGYISYAENDKRKMLGTFLRI